MTDMTCFKCKRYVYVLEDDLEEEEDQETEAPTFICIYCITEGKADINQLVPKKREKSAIEIAKALLRKRDSNKE